MKTRPGTWEAWLDRRQRRWLAWWGGHFRRLRGLDAGSLALFCDCEGHHAGAEGEQHADDGLDSLLGLLAREHLHITFNVVAELAQTHPARIRRIIGAGHEIGCHGYQHERPRDLAGPELDAMLTQADNCFDSHSIQLRGFRSPQSAWSLALTRRLAARECLWSAERDSARGPYRILDGLVRVPVLLDDWDLAERKASARELMFYWRKEIRRAVARGRIVSVGVHEWLFGREPDYAARLGELLTWLRTRLELRIVPVGDLMKIKQPRQRV